MPVIFITGHGTADTAIEAMRLGAYEYLLKPLELDHLTDLVERAFEISRLMRVPATIPEGRRGGARVRRAGRPLARRCRRCTRRSAASPRRT